jgi:hypothetical protein
VAGKHYGGKVRDRSKVSLLVNNSQAARVFPPVGLLFLVPHDLPCIRPKKHGS